VRNAHIRFGEQSSGALDPPIQHIAMRRHSSGRVKRPEEMTAAVANCRREFRKGKIRIQTALDVRAERSRRPLPSGTPSC
jgi:hypothetical protein